MRKFAALMSAIETGIADTADEPQLRKSLDAILKDLKAKAGTEDDDETKLPPRGSKKSKRDEGGVNTETFIPIVKLDDEERLVAGIVYEPEIVDAQGDSASAEEIRKACHDFMLNSMRIGLMHKDDISKDVRIVENYIAPADTHLGNQRVRKGSWVMVLKVLSEPIWKAVKGGELTGLSMSGYAVDQAA